MKAKSKNATPFQLGISKERLIEDLRKIGMKEGDTIAVSLSFKSIGYVRGGPNAFIDALLEAIGPDGTIMMNTYTRTFHPSKIATRKIDYIFDYKKTPAVTGIIPETLRNRKDSIRSRHPTCSVVAIGKLAKYLTKDHEENSSPYMPYSKLAKVNGKVLCIGIDDNAVAIRHEAQYLAGLFNIVPFKEAVKFMDRNGIVRIFTWNTRQCVDRLPEFLPILRTMGFVKDARIGMANSILFPAKEFLEIISKMLKKDPTLNLCNSFFCVWCRELERKLNLYTKVEKKKIFQKNSFVINLITLVNWFRLRNYVVDDILLGTSGTILKAYEIIPEPLRLKVKNLIQKIAL